MVQPGWHMLVEERGGGLQDPEPLTSSLGQADSSPHSRADARGLVGDQPVSSPGRLFSLPQFPCLRSGGLGTRSGVGEAEKVRECQTGPEDVQSLLWSPGRRWSQTHRQQADLCWAPKQLIMQ